MSHARGQCSSTEARREFNGCAAGKMGENDREEIRASSPSLRHGESYDSIDHCHVAGLSSVASPQYSPERFLVTPPEMFAGLCDNGLEDG